MLLDLLSLMTFPGWLHIWATLAAGALLLFGLHLLRTGLSMRHGQREQ